MTRSAQVQQFGLPLTVARRQFKAFWKFGILAFPSRGTEN
jgi:hypothetical protein